MGTNTLSNKQRIHLAQMIYRVRLRMASASLCGFEYYDKEDIDTAVSTVEKHVGGLQRKEFLHDIEKEQKFKQENAELRREVERLKTGAMNRKSLRGE